MRTRAILLLFLLAFVVSSVAQGVQDKVPAVSPAPQTVPAKNLPDVSADPHYKLIFHNEYTNVYLLKLKAGESAHSTFPHGFLRISMDPSKISFNPASDVDTEGLDRGNGDSFPAGGACFVKNVASTPYSAIVVEALKNKINPKLADGTPFLGFMPPSDASIEADPFDLGGITVNAVDVPPGKSTKFHTHKYPHLLVALTDMEMKVETKGKPAQRLELEPGNVKWVAPVLVEHRLLNTAKETPEDPKKKLEREQEGEEKEADEGEAMYVAIEFK